MAKVGKILGIIEIVAEVLLTVIAAIVAIAILVIVVLVPGLNIALIVNELLLIMGTTL